MIERVKCYVLIVKLKGGRRKSALILSVVDTFGLLIGTNLQAVLGVRGVE